MVLCNFVLYLAKFGRTKATAEHLIFLTGKTKIWQVFIPDLSSS